MENEDLMKVVTEKANMWLGEGYDDATKAEVKRMLEADDKTELIDSFYRDLEFGTGGLRGIMGAGLPTILRSLSRICPKFQS